MRRKIEDAPVPDENGFIPGKWWKVLDPEGKLWIETSSESEARREMREGDAIYRLHVKTEYEWREA